MGGDLRLGRGPGANQAMSGLGAKRVLSWAWGLIWPALGLDWRGGRGGKDLRPSFVQNVGEVLLGLQALLLEALLVSALPGGIPQSSAKKGLAGLKLSVSVVKKSEKVEG